MRVLFVNQYYAPDEAATAQLLSDLAETAARAGLDCRVIAARRGYANPSRQLPKRETLHGVHVVRVATTGFGRRNATGRLIDYIGFLLGACFQMLRAPRPDVLVGLSTPPILGFLTALMARGRGCRAVYWTMDVYPELAIELGALRRGSILCRLLSRASRAALASADLVVALGETMRERLVAQGARRVAVIHNWADGEKIRATAHDENAYRRERGWGPSDFVVLYSGNLGLAHEFETVLDAAEKLRERADIIFAFVGAGPRLEELRSAAHSRGLSRFEFLSTVPRERLPESLTAGDLHLITLRPRLAGLLVPSKLYGALAAGRPVLYAGPADCEVHDILIGEACGMSVRNGDSEGMYAAILAYQADAVRRELEGVRARAAFDRRFSRERQTTAFLSALRGLR